ncbi:MAG: glycosyltransferase family 1 protein [Muribaculaceae bacterium]
MKILLIGDASNYHACLGGALRRLGHDVTVASSGSRWMHTHRDIDLSRPLPGKAGGALLALKLAAAARRLRGFDIVQISNPVFVELRPHRVKKIFDDLRRYNGAVYLTALGIDVPYYRMCCNTDCPLRYNDVFDHRADKLRVRQDDWLNKPLVALNDHVYSHIDGVITALYEYHLSVQRILPPDKIAYAGIPIDTQSIEPRPIAPDGRKISIFLGRHSYRMAEKGTDILEKAARIVAQRHPDTYRLDIVENLPYHDYVQRLRAADIVLDQLYSYTPATNALLAMAHGQAVVSGAEPEYYRFIGEDTLHPIINCSPDDSIDSIADIIQDAIADRDRLRQRGRRSRDFAVKHNDSITVAQRFINFWTR